MDPITPAESSAAAQAKLITLYLLTFAILILCGLIAFPFLSAIAGAVTLAVATDRPYRWLQAKVRYRSLAAALAVITITLILITPVFFLVEKLVSQGLAAVTLLRSGVPQLAVQGFINNHPSIASQFRGAINQIDLSDVLQKAAGYASGMLSGLLSNSFGAITQLVLMVVILFFLYRDRGLAVTTLRALLPLNGQETDQLLKACSDTIYATATGRLVVSLVQGTLATLAYWYLGFSGALWLGLATVIAAMIPVFGALCVWAPIAIYLTITGHWGQGLLLAIWGGLVVSTIDNYLYPVLVGSRIEQHTITILLSVLGGVALFGIPGIILGPLLLSIAKTLLQIWRRRSQSAAETVA
jgi:predicted PurR-regulated permease PerM